VRLRMSCNCVAKSLELSPSAPQTFLTVQPEDESVGAERAKERVGIDRVCVWDEVVATVLMSIVPGLKNCGKARLI